jgi:hypothetical protein
MYVIVRFLGIFHICSCPCAVSTAVLIVKILEWMLHSDTCAQPLHLSMLLEGDQTSRSCITYGAGAFVRHKGAGC